MRPELQSAATRKLAALAPIIPVIVVPDAAQADGLGRALVKGGLPVLEVTLRSDAALDAIRAMATIPGAHVGAGTVLSRDDMMRARDAGATFAVSPGLTDALAAAAEEAGLPLLPGIATASEAMRAQEMGYDFLKFFPAATSGGPKAIAAIGAPLPRLAFCPTGGISTANATEYLALPNVLCAGGSWVSPRALIDASDWAEVTRLAKTASELPRG